MMDDLIRRSEALEALGDCPYNWCDMPEEIQEVSDWRTHYEAIKQLPAISPARVGYNNNEVACIIAELMGDDCACNFNGIDEWLPYYCEFRDTCCPHPVGVACWEQYLTYRDKRDGRENE